MRQRLKIIVNGRPYLVEMGDPSASPLTVTVNGKPYTVNVETPTAEGETGVSPARSSTDASTVKQLTAPLPGTIIEIGVKPGDQVALGQQLCTLEAMKMKSAIRSPRAGVIATVAVSEGQGVAFGDLLVTFE